MRRRTFLRNLAAAVVIPWTKVLAPIVGEPKMPDEWIKSWAPFIARCMIEEDCRMKRKAVLMACGSAVRFRLEYPDG